MGIDLVILDNEHYIMEVAMASEERKRFITGDNENDVGRSVKKARVPLDELSDEGPLTQEDVIVSNK